MSARLAVMIAGGMAAWWGVANAAPPPEAPPPEPAAAAAKAPPTLDELLGLASTDAPADGNSRTELDRKLAEESPGDLFEQAIALMGDSAQRLTDAGDPGLQTQRTQEEALRKLDQLISSMERRSQDQQQQQQQQQQNRDSQSQRQQANQQNSRDRQTTDSTDSSAQDLPGRRDGALRPGLEAAKAAWGALPARIREMLLQGQGETFSKSYEKMTEDYYKKLAEQRP